MRCVGENSSPKVAAKPPASSENGNPKNDGRGMLEIPLGPPVKLCQLSRTRRMISPKASVTMAR